MLGSLCVDKACESTGKACFRTLRVAALERSRFAAFVAPPRQLRFKQAGSVGADLRKELHDVAPGVIGALAICIRQTACGLEILGDRMEHERRKRSARSDARDHVPGSGIDVDFGAT